MGSLSQVTPILTSMLSLEGMPSALIASGMQALSQQQTRDQLKSQQGLALEQLKARQTSDEQTSTQDAALQKAALAADSAANEDRRQSALRRAVAKQKTLFSAQGLGGVDAGSNEAVLLGLYNNTQEDANIQAQSDAMKTAALDQNLNQQKQKNLLEATQLAERQRLARIIG